MIRFAIMLRSKMNIGTYKFVSKVFNLLSSLSVSKYESTNGSSKDGVLYGVLQILRQRLEESKKKKMDENRSEWMRMGSFAFDSMSIKNKVKFDAHSMELVEFEEGTLKEDVLLKELNVLDTKTTNYDDKK